MTKYNLKDESYKVISIDTERKKKKACDKPKSIYDSKHS